MLLKPKDVKIRKKSEEGNTAVFSFEPLPKGFGHTLGNTLRRILLTSLEGAAVTQIKIDNVVHEFSTIEGVKEDVVEISLNFKDIKASIHSENPVVGTIEVKGEGKVTAGDIKVPSDVEIINKDLHIATLADSKAEFKAEVVFEPGVGYSPVEDRETSKIGVILLDAMFSPILDVNYRIEKTRKGTVADLDELLLTIETDGSVDPEDALTQAATLLRKFFARFADGEDDPEELEEEEKEIVQSSVLKTRKVLVEELPLPTRTINALRKAGIETLTELAEKSEDELADIKNIGAKSISEVEKLLEEEGLNE